MPPCPVGIPLKQIPDGRAWASPLQPPLSGHAFGVGTICPQERQAGTFVSSPCGDRSIKRGLFSSPTQKKKEEPGNRGLCRSLPPANASGLNPYIVEFGHSTTQRGDSRILGPQKTVKEPQRNFFAVRIGSFFCVKGYCRGGDLYILFRILTTCQGDLAPNYLFFYRCEKPQAVDI